MTDSLAVRGGRVIDPANGIDAAGDVLIADGRIAAVGNDAGKGASRAIDATGLIVCPGFVDIHAHLREPGFEHKETIATGTQAAARGGFTTVCCMPNTEPPIDSAAVVEYVVRTARTEGAVRVLPIGCVTKGRKGEALAELAELAQAGVVAFSDDGDPVSDPHLLRRALEYARPFGLPLIGHCEDRALATGGVMHEGWVAARLGLRGVPAAAEESAVARDIALAALTGARLHVAHVSTAGAVELIRRARASGLPVTAEVTPHHLTLTHEAVLVGSGESPGWLAYDTNAKVNPPLRTREDAEACLQGLLDGTIDCVATDHAPHAVEDKLCEFDLAAPGISGLETALALCLTLVHDGRLGLPMVIEKLTVGPVRALGLHGDRVGAGLKPAPTTGSLEGLGTLSVGAPGDVAVIDPGAEWVIEPERFASKGKNTPLAGRTLRGRVVATVYEGRVVYQA
ncbi:MAG: dihydroorotase [Chloroflexi bacterium]|nr:dihydroorotase [Chloroflexota bacterium]